MSAHHPMELGFGPSAETYSRAVASSAQLARSRRRIVELCDEPRDATELRLLVLDEISTVVAFDAFAWLLTDPETSVGCGPLADVPSLPQLPLLIRLKYATPINRWTTLTDPPAVSLHEATGGDLQESAMWRDLLCQYDVADVLSAVFRDRFGCWGFLDLWRCGAAPFGDDEVQFVADLAEPMTAALRRAQAATFMEPPAERRPPVGPVVLMLSPRVQVIAQTAETDRFLRVLVPPGPSGSPIPANAYNVGAQLLAVETGIDTNPPTARAHLANGQWVTVRASRLGGPDPVPEQNIAVTIETTSPAERLELFARAFALSARETDIVRLLATGIDTRDVAHRAFISEHTVQDHLKSVFAKTGMSTRRTLLARATGA